MKNSKAHKGKTNIHGPGVMDVVSTSVLSVPYVFCIDLHCAGTMLYGFFFFFYSYIGHDLAEGPRHNNESTNSPTRAHAISYQFSALGTTDIVPQSPRFR